MEKEDKGKLLFLYVLTTTENNGSLGRHVYRKFVDTHVDICSR